MTARRAELDGLEEQLARQPAEVRAERDELAVAEKVLERMSEQLAEERAASAPDVSVRSKLEPLRGKLVRLVDRGWLRKQPDGRFTVRLCVRL
ncbi:hypothetical protein [Streptomyces coelicoflavus]|uniref:hypothetical protein n=1 Tax=Streptomyces coelicoflavus TaxID=285562 RepID=UPI0030B919C1